MRMVTLSDLGFGSVDPYSYDNLPKANILTICGNVTATGAKSEWDMFNVFLQTISPKYQRILMLDANNTGVEYLCPPPNFTDITDKSVYVGGFMVGGFTGSTEEEALAFIDRVKSEQWQKRLDVLVTYQPGYGTLDSGNGIMSHHTITAMLKPRVHVFGKDRTNYGAMVLSGITRINTCQTNETNERVNEPMVFDVYTPEEIKDATLKTIGKTSNGNVYVGVHPSELCDRMLKKEYYTILSAATLNAARNSSRMGIQKAKDNGDTVVWGTIRSSELYRQIPEQFCLDHKQIDWLSVRMMWCKTRYDLVCTEMFKRGFVMVLDWPENVSEYNNHAVSSEEELSYRDLSVAKMMSERKDKDTISGQKWVWDNGNKKWVGDLTKYARVPSWIANRIKNSY